MARSIVPFLALVVLAMLAVVAAQGTVKPANIDAVTVVTKPPVGAPAQGAAPAATPVYVPAPIPEASENSTTFRKVPNVNCTDAVAMQVQKIYSKNRLLFDTCAEASKYQIFPFSGKLPTQEQIYALATNKACTALFTAVVLADLPQCDISNLGLKSVVETLLKVTVDIDNGKPTPDTMRFHYMHTWRRDSNLAQAAHVPYANDSALYKEYTSNLWTALTKYNVHVLPDLRIEYNVSEIATAMNGKAGPFTAMSMSAGSMAGSRGSSGSSGHHKGEEVTTPPSPSANATKLPATKSAATSVTGVSVVAALCAALALAVL